MGMFPKNSNERSLPPLESQRVSALSRPQVASLPSWAYATQSVPEAWAFQFLTRLPSLVSQSLTVPSSLEEARSFESGRQLREVTADLWPASVNNSWPLSGSHRLTPPLRSAVARLWRV